MRLRAAVLQSTIFYAALFVSSIETNGGGPRDQITRKRFAEALSRVQCGMIEDEALALMGTPHDVRTRTDGDEFMWTLAPRILCYGTDGHLTFPTLGQVCIGSNGKVLATCGGSGEPPGPSILAEDELREILRSISDAPKLNGAAYNPRNLIRIVNRLQKLGKDRAVAALSEYLRVAPPVTSKRSRVFLVLRVLFDLSDESAHHPMIRIGKPLPAPIGEDAFPRFPILLERDVPCLLTIGYSSLGNGFRVETHVEFYRRNGSIRSRPLLPTDDPLGVLDDVDMRCRERLFDKDAGIPFRWRLMIMSQLLRLVESVYPMDTDKFGFRLQRGPAFEQRWAEIEDQVQALHIAWDPETNDYRAK